MRLTKSSFAEQDSLLRVDNFFFQFKAAQVNIWSDKEMAKFESKTDVSFQKTKNIQFYLSSLTASAEPIIFSIQLQGNKCISHSSLCTS